jgi:hypothetical protein
MSLYIIRPIQILILMIVVLRQEQSEVYIEQLSLQYFNMRD